MIKEYKRYKEIDFIIVGRHASMFYKSFNIEDIMDIIKDKVSKRELISLIKNYFIGYKIGIIEVSLSNAGEVVIFNPFDHRLYKKVGDKEELITRKEEFKVIEQKAREKAKYVLNKKLGE